VSASPDNLEGFPSLGVPLYLSGGERPETICTVSPSTWAPAHSQYSRKRGFAYLRPLTELNATLYLGPGLRRRQLFYRESYCSGWVKLPPICDLYRLLDQFFKPGRRALTAQS
jgi:hypothetical protein